MSENDLGRSELLALTGEVVSAYVSNNSVARTDLPGVITNVFESLSGLVNSTGPEPTPPTPAVSVRKSVTEDYLICLEDGKKFKMLKRHLRTAYGMTPEEYRAKWNLSADYPMTAPAYARERQKIAKENGLGHKLRAKKQKLGDTPA
ncbi:MucR family transcriptional regulator [Pelagibius sp. Alg239-R121]|uniref:MucR family transcriptional regulator n=1 Tax=Pelagibius sp. Alg239-R121 TaxID=2993448 RepID=UPI0024A68731|nr:MucR family transcriptional regulator [Pelagibius sp. Alg239-R121]